MSIEYLNKTYKNCEFEKTRWWGIRKNHRRLTIYEHGELLF